MSLLIAEISNHHHGSMSEAKKLIRIAKESGADAVKGQAFEADDMVKCGSMSFDFYKTCQLKYKQCIDLIDYGKEIGIDVFFSIISHKFLLLNLHMKYKKVHASLYLTKSLQSMRKNDDENQIVSIPYLRKGKHGFDKTKVLYATPYLDNGSYKKYEEIKDFFKKDIGLSHHGLGMEGLRTYIYRYKLPVIEKHFYLGKYISDKRIVYRDCYHSFSPVEFEELAKTYKG